MKTVYLLAFLLLVSVSSAATLDMAVGRHYVSFDKTAEAVSSMSEDCLAHRIIVKFVGEESDKPLPVLPAGKLNEDNKYVQKYNTEHSMLAGYVYEIMNFKECSISFKDEEIIPAIKNGGNYIASSFEITRAHIETICGVEIKRGRDWKVFSAKSENNPNARFFGAFNKRGSPVSFNKGFFEKMTPYHGYYIEVSGLADDVECVVTKEKIDELDAIAATTTTSTLGTSTETEASLPFKITPNFNVIRDTGPYTLERGVNAIGLTRNQVSSLFACDLRGSTNNARIDEKAVVVTGSNNIIGRGNIKEDTLSLVGYTNEEDISQTVLPEGKILPAVVLLGGTCNIPIPSTNTLLTIELKRGTNFISLPVPLTADEMETILKNCIGEGTDGKNGNKLMAFSGKNKFAYPDASGNYKYTNSMEAYKSYFAVIETDADADPNGSGCSFKLFTTASTGQKFCKFSTAGASKCTGDNALLPGK
jgi:hypothetical protein